MKLFVLYFAHFDCKHKRYMPFFKSKENTGFYLIRCGYFYSTMKQKCTLSAAVFFRVVTYFGVLNYIFLKLFSRTISVERSHLITESKFVLCFSHKSLNIIILFQLCLQNSSDFFLVYGLNILNKK